MDFRIADSFTESLARLTGDEQKAVKATAFGLQLIPVSPVLSFHKLDKAKEKNFWLVRVNANIRVIVHQTPGSLLLCYVGHQENAYDWAGRRTMETHPKTGAAQLVEIREGVTGILGPAYVQTEFGAPPLPPPAEKKPIFGGMTDDELLGYGVPGGWLAAGKQVTEETLPVLADHLPAEAAEALLELAVGGKPRAPQLAMHTANPFNHPDARRRFRVMTNAKELERALDFPGEKWMVFLHPEQRLWVESDHAGAARVSGSAGTGKTIVALHRAAHLARTHGDARILLTTFSDTLANVLRTKLGRLMSNEPHLAERIEVQSINAIGVKLYEAHVGPGTMVSDGVLRELVRKAASAVEGHEYEFQFLIKEWEEVVDAWQLESKEVYRDVVRLGRKTRLSEGQRTILWAIFERVRAELKTRKLVTGAQLFSALAAVIERQKKVVFDFVVADEAQDLSVAQLRFLAAVGAGRANALFFAGDLGQRIFQQPFSWKALGVDILGRSRTLRVNYRMSHPLRAWADRLLGATLTDVDGCSEKRNDTISVFHGPAPAIHALKSQREESRMVGEWIAGLTRAGVLPHEFGVFVRTAAQVDRARAAVKLAGKPFKILDERVAPTNGHVSICAMPFAKGLEFQAVAVMACDEGIIPSKERIGMAGDGAGLKEVHDTERHLFYVACTRARDHLMVTGVGPVSEYLRNS